jgi:hypothetical protein
VSMSPARDGDERVHVDLCSQNEHKEWGLGLDQAVIG